MPSHSNIVKRPGSANRYYRRAYPEDVQRALGRREFWKSLGTSKLPAARAAATRVEFEFMQLVNGARRRASPSEVDMDRQVAAFYERALELDEAPRLAAGEDGELHVGHTGSLKSVQRYWRRTFPAPAFRARRRVETPVGAQAQVDWAEYPGMVLGGEVVELSALTMTLSLSRKRATVWARSWSAPTEVVHPLG